MMMMMMMKCSTLFAHHVGHFVTLRRGAEDRSSWQRSLS